MAEAIGLSIAWGLVPAAVVYVARAHGDAPLRRDDLAVVRAARWLPPTTRASENC